MLSTPQFEYRTQSNELIFSSTSTTPSTTARMRRSRKATIDKSNRIFTTAINTQRSNKVDGAGYTFEDINIDDVLREAEAALEAAEVSLAEDNDDNNDNRNGKQIIHLSSTHQKQPQMSEGRLMKQRKDIIFCTVGGIIFGLILGSITAIEFPIIANEFVLDPLEIPVISGVLVGVFGFVGCAATEESSILGRIIRTVIGKPTEILVNSALQAAQRKADQTAQNIQAIPGRVADSVQTSVKRATQSAVDEVTSIPRKAKDQIISSGIFERNFLLAVIVIPSLVAIIILVADSILSGRDLSFLLPTSLSLFAGLA